METLPISPMPILHGREYVLPRRQQQVPEQCREIADLPYDEFFRKYLIEKYNAKALSCGENYTFGARGEGNVEKLRKLCEEYSVELHIAPTQTYNGETVSSSKIRNLLSDGDIRAANAMLGREFSYRSIVLLLNIS